MRLCVKILLAAVALMGCSLANATASTNDITSYVQRGLFEEEANHNLDAAMQAYQSAITLHDKDRKLAATAIFRLGECYRKEGKTNEANAYYQRILNEFSDQTELAKLSRQYLGKNNSQLVATRTKSAAEPPTTSEEDEEIRKIKEMIEDSPDLINRAAADNHYTPLQSAAIAGHLRVVQYLVENGADINFGGMVYVGSTISTPPLVYAAANGHNAIVAYLLSKGANVNAADGDGNTALHWATIHDFMVVAQTLLAHNPTVNATNSSGRTALHIAAQNDKGLVKLLLDHDAEVNVRDKKGETPLLSALRSRKPSIVQLLISHNADVNVADATGFTPLLVAAQNDDLTSAKILLDKGADPEAQIPPHFLAGGPGYVSPGYVSNYEIATYRAINFAIGKNDSKLVNLMLDHHADPNLTFTWYWNIKSSEPGVTPLIMAALQDRPSIAEILINRGATVNSTDEKGATALHFAAKLSETNIAAILLSHGAGVNALDKSHVTPLFDAVCQQKPNTNLVALLIDHHADVNTPNVQGRPPIYCVTVTPPTSEQQAVRDQLIKAGADPDYLRRQVIAVGRHDAFGKLSTGTSVDTGTNQFRQFTLLEMLSHVYEGKNLGFYEGTNGPYFDTAAYKQYGFPDFAHVIIHRLGNDGKQTDIKVNVGDILQNRDCGKDLPLVGGDIVELPEADHPVGQKWEGLTAEQQDAFRQCLQRTVTVKIKGSTTNLTICPPLPRYVYPQNRRRFGNQVPPELQGVVVSFCWLNNVLDSSGVLLASSDTSRIKIIRPHQLKELVYNLASEEQNNAAQMPWLEPGDTIEIPDRVDAAK